MKITKRQRRLIMVYANLITAMVGIGSFTYTTLAWFAKVNTRQVRMESVRVIVPGFAITGFDCFEVTSMTYGETTTSVAFANEIVTSLDVYDPQWQMSSSFLPAIVVRLQFSYEAEDSVTLSATTENSTFSTGTTGSGATDDNFTSNAFQITTSSGPSSSLGENWTSSSLTYTNANSHAFVSVSATPSKSTEVSVITINPGDSEVWFVLEYSQAVMEYIDNARIGIDRDVIYHDDITYLVA